MLCCYVAGETDWKVIAIDVSDPLAAVINDIEDIDAHMPGFLRVNLLSLILTYFYNSTKGGYSYCSVRNVSCCFDAVCYTCSVTVGSFLLQILYYILYVSDIFNLYSSC